MTSRFTLLAALVVSVLAAAACGKSENPVGNDVGRITGKVIDGSTGSPLAGATVSTTPGTQSVVTDASGAYSIADVAPGAYSVMAVKGGYNGNSVSVTLASGKTVTADISLSRGGGGNSDTLTPPYAPAPADGAAGQAVYVVLGWTAMGPAGDTIRYDVYFGTDPAPALVASDVKDAQLVRGGLAANTKYYWRVVAKTKSGLQASGPVWNFTTTSTENNTPPTAPTNPTPANGAASQPYTLNLRWASTDPDGDPVRYDVLFGTSATPTDVVASDLGATTLSRTGLAGATTYYWQVIAKDNHNGVTPGPIWSFTVKSNLPPNAPMLPIPANGAVNQSVSPRLQWTGSDDDADELTYDVYLSINTPPTQLVASALSTPSYSATGLLPSTTYFWKVVANDGHGGQTSSPIWSFTTAGVPVTGLVAFYPFNGNASDASENGHDGVVDGAVLTTDRHGSPNSAYYFANKAKISVPHAPQLNLGKGPATYAAWVKFQAPAAEYAGIINKGPKVGSYYPGIQLSIRSGTQFSITYGRIDNDGDPNDDAGFMTVAKALNDNRWHFLTFTVSENGTVRSYVDGVLMVTDVEPFVDLSDNNTAPMLFGVDRTEERWFVGSIDDVRIYDVALTAGEVEALAAQ